MMKLKKDQFKKILKECILELIGEGAFDKVINESLRTMPRTHQSSMMSEQINGSNQPYEHVGHMTPNQRLKEVARLAAGAAAGNNPKQAAMLNAIFEDTAMTTLQKQMGALNTGDGSLFIGEQVDPSVEAADRAELEALSGVHGTNHWAALAFGNAGRKK